MEHDPSFSLASSVVHQEKRNNLSLRGNGILMSKRGRCPDSRKIYSSSSSSSSRRYIQRSNILMKSTASIGDVTNKKLLKRSVRNLQELPQEVLLRILEYIDMSSPHNTSMIALSETSNTMNYLCHKYLVRRWDVSSSAKIRIVDSETIRKDGILQRLQLEDPRGAAELYKEFIQGDDTDDKNTNHRRNGSLDIAISIRVKIFLESTTEMIRLSIRRVLQQQKVIFKDLYRQLTMYYYNHHTLYATRTHIQEEISALLYSLFKVGIGLLVLTFMLLPDMYSVTNDYLAVANHDGSMFVIVLTFCCLCVALSSILMFIVTSAASCSKLIHKHQQPQQADEDGADGDERMISFIVKSNAILECETPLRRSHSQPEFVSFATSETTDKSITTDRMKHMTRPTFRTPLKRSQSIASSSPALFGESNEDAKLDQECNLTSSRYNEEERYRLPERHFVPTTVRSFDYGYSSYEDEFGSFMYLDDEGDEVEIRVSDHKSGAVVTSSLCVTPLIQNGCFKNPTKGASAASTQSSAGFESLVVVPRTKPRGWVGMYRRALYLAKKRIIHMVNDSRAFAYKTLNMSERNDLSSSLMNACVFDSDNAVSVMRLLSKSIPTQDFYIGVDGTETCALHTAAFHGSSKVIDFLCREIDTTYYYCDRPATLSCCTVGSASFTYDDGGLCDVNVTDMNGWTALHYAVGANNIDAVRVLLNYGASLHLPAANGYTPLQWAIRLQHHNVTNELRSAMITNQQEHQCHGYWYPLLEKVKHSIFTIIVLSLLVVPNFGLIHVNSDSA